MPLNIGSRHGLKRGFLGHSVPGKLTDPYWRRYLQLVSAAGTLYFASPGLGTVLTDELDPTADLLTVGDSSVHRSLSGLHPTTVLFMPFGKPYVGALTPDLASVNPSQGSRGKGGASSIRPHGINPMTGLTGVSP